MAIVTDALVGGLVSLLFDQVLQKVKLLAEGDDKFWGLQSLLRRLKKPTNYLVHHEYNAGNTLVDEWVEEIRKELAKAESLVTKWPKIQRWDLRGRHHALKRLIRIMENLQQLDNCQTVHLASNVHNFDRLSEEVGRLGDGVDRFGEAVRICVESLTSEVRSLTAERRDFARATADTLAQVHSATFPEKLEEIKRKALRYCGSRANPEAGSGPSQFSEAATHFNCRDAFPDEIFGGNDIVDAVVTRIFNDDFLGCIGLWSMGGAGKTFTAARVFHDPRIQGHFNKRIWVTVAKRESYSVMKEIFVKLGGYEAYFPAADDLYSVRSALKQRLNIGKYLLVIDDVWEAAQLDFTDLISETDVSKESSRVTLVTTRLKDILDRKHATTITVTLLSEEDSWKLFSRNAFGRAQVPSELKYVSRCVAAECKGLPLALKVIGSTLAGETNLQVWENSLKKLKHVMVLGKDHESQVFGRLQLSIENLQDRGESGLRLQHCFYYFAAYPEDEDIRAEELVTFWTAEGIVERDLDSPISSESEGYELIGTLISLSMIEVAHSFKGTIKIHDVMRDLARYNLENNFGQLQGVSLGKKIPISQRLCLYRSGLQLRTFPKDWTGVQGADAIPSTALAVERLSLTRNELLQLPEQFDAPRLRVLLLARNLTLKSLPDRFFKSFRSLRVLDLRETSIEEVPDAVFDLFSLVLLNLGFCGFLRQIPASIERLQNLQHLRICHCKLLTSLPRGLRRLTSLKVLNAEETLIWDGLEHFSGDNGLTFPRRNTSLEVSSRDDGLESSSEDIATLEDVAAFSSLQSLSITSFSPSPVSEIGQLTALQSAALTCPKWEFLPENFTNLVNLKRLTLYCSCATLPALDELQHLEYLYIMSHKLESFPDSFARAGAFPLLQTFTTNCSSLHGPALQPGAMPRLKSFIIQGARSMELSESFRVLGGLKYLQVSYCESLENLLAFEEPNSFPCLEEIDFTGSSSLQNLPAGMLKSAPNLRSIRLRGANVNSKDIPEDLLQNERLKQLEIEN